MRFDSTFTAFVLKTQPLGEADLLVTWYTKEQGKLRAVAVGTRKPRSRLAFALQPAACASIRLVGRSEHGLLKLAGATPIATYISEYSEEQGLCISWLSEVVLRATADAEQNQYLFGVAEDFFSVLATMVLPAQVRMLTALTLVHVLHALGVAIHEETKARFFTIRGGGFFAETAQADKLAVSEALWARFGVLQGYPLAQAQELSVDAHDGLLALWMESFLEYHIERPIRSFQFLRDIIT